MATMRNIRHNSAADFFALWKIYVAPTDAAEKNGNMGAQLQSLRCTTATEIFW